MANESVKEESTQQSGTEPQIVLHEGLSIGYKKSLAKVTTEIRLGEGTHYLLARNGRGKTTLLRTLAGVLKSLGGKYTCYGKCQFC